MSVRTVEDIRALAHRHVPAERVDDAMAGVSPAWRLVPSADGPVRIGGDAPLADGESWPCNARGIPMTFLASVDADAVPDVPEGWGALPGWPRGAGVLRIFADLLAVPFETCAARVVVTPAGAALRDTPPPPVPDPWPVDPDTAGQEGTYDDLDVEDRERQFPGSSATLEPALSADVYRFGWEDDPDLEAYQAFADEVWAPVLTEWDDMLGESAYASGLGKLGGAPHNVQDDPRWDAIAEHPEFGEDRDGWVILLEVHSGWGPIDILDGGAYCICVPAVRLAEGRFDPAVCTVHSG